MSLESLSTARQSMRLLVQAANEDKELLANRSWQDAMIHLNAFIRKYQEKQPGKLLDEEASRIKRFRKHVESANIAPLLTPQPKAV